MILLRYLLFPFAILYGWITSVRNFLYDQGILKSYSFDLPVIAVGNLSIIDADDQIARQDKTAGEGVRGDHRRDHAAKPAPGFDTG